MIPIYSSSAWRTSFPGGIIGLLETSKVILHQNSDTQLDERKRETEEHLRQRYQGFTRQELLRSQVLEVYSHYYKHFNKTYHVLLQLESIVMKSKNLPNVTPLVDASFISELESCILTAGHDVDQLIPPIVIDISREGDSMTLMNGNDKKIYPGDMIMRDEKGICCSIIYGQDNRSMISHNTNHVLYVSYAPAGIPDKLVEAHLNQIEAIVLLVSPQAHVERKCLITAEQGKDT